MRLNTRHYINVLSKECLLKRAVEILTYINDGPKNTRSIEQVNTKFEDDIESKLSLLIIIGELQKAEYVLAWSHGNHNLIQVTDAGRLYLKEQA